MLTPILVSTIFILIVVVLCFIKPNAGRIFLGFFYMAMAIGINGSFTFRNPQAYLAYASEALVPLYGKLMATVVSFISPTVFGLLLMAFEISMGLLLLHKNKSVKIGLVGTILFLISMVPLSWLQFPWLGLIVAEVHLLSKNFDTSFWALLQPKNSGRN